MLRRFYRKFEPYEYQRIKHDRAPLHMRLVRDDGWSAGPPYGVRRARDRSSYLRYCGRCS